MTIRDQIKSLIEKAIKTAQKEKKLPKFEIPEIVVEHPEEKSYGDYATNSAMVIASLTGKEPMEIAGTIVQELRGYRVDALDRRVEAKNPGFINFSLSSRYLQEQIGEIFKEKEKFGEVDVEKGKKVQVEFISANPTGPLHLGHGRGAFFGDILANVFKKAGYGVEREYYINDARKSTQIQVLGKTVLGRGEAYLGDYLKSKIKRLKPKLKNIKDEGEAGYTVAQEIHKDIRNFIEKKLKIKFDKWFSEESLYKSKEIDRIYQWLKKKNFVYKKEGAEWLKTSKYGDDKDWVIVRATGEPTYFLSDIAYHKNKFERGYDKIVNVWGADHQGHVRKMKAMAKMLGYKGDLELLITQMVRLKEKGKGLKLSKRAGIMVELEWLIDEVGLDVARFMFLMKSIDTQMEFDLALAKEKSEKNPVYYVQYGHARICSILKKCKMQGARDKMVIQNAKLNLLNHPNELGLIKELIKLPEVVEDTAKDYQTQRFPSYAMEIATAFHKFYDTCRVISDDKNLTRARLTLVLATKIVLENVLGLMGVSAPRRM